MGYMRMTADDIIIFNKTFIIHLVNTKLTPVRIIQIAMHEKKRMIVYQTILKPIMVHHGFQIFFRIYCQDRIGIF